MNNNPEKKSKTCPDCGKKLEKKEMTYGTYRDRYRDEKHPEGKLFVCGKCYIG